MLPFCNSGKFFFEDKGEWIRLLKKKKKKRTCRTVCTCTDDVKTRAIVPFSSMDKGEFLIIPNIGCILV